VFLSITAGGIALGTVIDNRFRNRRAAARRSTAGPAAG